MMRYRIIDTGNGRMVDGLEAHSMMELKEKLDRKIAEWMDGIIEEQRQRAELNETIMEYMSPE